VRGMMGASVFPSLNAMTGVAFVLFTFYMLTDPATTPSKFQRQILFGFGVSFVYGLLVIFHIVFGLFFALSLVCVLRGVLMTAEYVFEKTRRHTASVVYEFPSEEELSTRLATEVVSASGSSGGRR
jgi:enediyne biosynthesis protein E5